MVVYNNLITNTFYQSHKRSRKKCQRKFPKATVYEQSLFPGNPLTSDSYATTSSA